jgi:hypothetical protein
MHVVIDGEPREGYANDGTVVETVGQIVETLRQEGRAVVALKVNGEQLTPEALTDSFGDVPVADALLELTTRQLHELVIESLDQLREMLPELPEACRRLAEVFQSETPEMGYEPFEELARVWEAIKVRQRTVASAMDLDLQAVEVHGLAVAEHLRELNGFLVEAAQALRDGDTILLGDLLEYELAPRAELETELVAVLRQHAETARA